MFLFVTISLFGRMSWLYNGIAITMAVFETSKHSTKNLTKSVLDQTGSAVTFNLLWHSKQHIYEIEIVNTKIAGTDVI